MKSIAQSVLITLLILSSAGFAQVTQQRRPELTAEASAPNAAKPSDRYFSILNGLPILFEVHHDTEAGTNKPVDVFLFVIEMQVMNSDGNLEPVGLQIFNFFTAHPQDAANDVNPHNARDCRIWNTLVTHAIRHRDPNSTTWPYVQFIAAQGARVLQTNEDGPVYWSDDIECWGSMDRFPPF
jgi:hypothetical protein